MNITVFEEIQSVTRMIENLNEFCDSLNADVIRFPDEYITDAEQAGLPREIVMNYRSQCYDRNVSIAENTIHFIKTFAIPYWEDVREYLKTLL
ncbi:MAG: hypothetical protein J6031_06610 [Bacteroidales bacterium]|nr:hypothetical protein [Bacteroidales bacterium]